MRIVLEGGEGGMRGRIARALALGGCTIVDAGERHDARLTVGDAIPRCIVRGDLTIDRALGQVRLGGRPLRLSPIEYALLGAIATAATPLDRVALLRIVWGLRFDPGTNLVAVHVSRLRAKIGPGRLCCGPAGYFLADRSALESETRFTLRALSG